METIPLTEDETNFLKDRLKQDEQSTIGQVLAFTLFVVVIIFLPGRGGDPSLYQEYGFLWSFITLYSSMSIALVVWKYQTQKRLKTDLQNGIKIIQPFLILRQEKSFAKKQYYLWLDTSEKSFQKFTFPLDDASIIEKTDYLILEYAPKSKTIFSQRFKESVDFTEGT